MQAVRFSCFLNLVVVSVLALHADHACAADTVLVATEWPPFEFSENQTFKGTDVEVATAAFKRMNRPVRILNLPWKRCLDMIKSKTADGIFTLRKDVDRIAYMEFPEEPISFSENMLFYVQTRPFHFQSLSDVKGLTIGGVLGYSYGEEFLKSNGYKVELVKDDEAGFRKLLVGRTDLFIADKLVGLFVLKKLGLNSKITYAPKPVSRFEMYLAFAKDKTHKELAAEFSRTLRAMKSDGSYEKIVGPYKQAN